ncbi:MAG: HD domain-containing protein [archaeon]|nr:HD domain-containing protein [archaeon]
MVFLRKLSDKEIKQLQVMQDFVKNAHSHSTSHDYSHVLSVCKNAIQIAKKIKEEVDPFVIISASLLHDIGKTNNLFSHIHGLLGGALAEEFLDGINLDEDYKNRICRAVIRHTPTSLLPPETNEEKVIFDADALDRIGLMGLLRGFIGKSGSMSDILTKYMNKRLLTYEQLQFEESKRMCDLKNNEMETYISIIEIRLKARMDSIENIFKSEGLV